MLRTFSSSPLEVEQLPSPLSLVLGGQWVGYLAGGTRHHATFGSNPQYMISAQHKTQVGAALNNADYSGRRLNKAYRSRTFEYSWDAD